MVYPQIRAPLGGAPKAPGAFLISEGRRAAGLLRLGVAGLFGGVAWEVASRATSRLVVGRFLLLVGPKDDQMPYCFWLGGVIGEGNLRIAFVCHGPAGWVY